MREHQRRGRSRWKVMSLITARTGKGPCRRGASFREGARVDTCLPSSQTYRQRQKGEVMADRGASLAKRDGQGFERRSHQYEDRTWHQGTLGPMEEKMMGGHEEGSEGGNP